MADTVSELQVVVSADTSAAERSLQSLGSNVNSFANSFKEGLGFGAGFAAIETGLSALSAGFGALKSSAVDFNQTIDSARASMSRFFDSNESLNNSIANLNTLAAKTPFAFEGLLVAQQRTIGAARSSDELKQNMDAIAVAAANTGRVSTANMERISLALGQMQAKGHLAGGEMLQLTEAGVNVGEILSKHFGVATSAIQKMASEGKISSQDVFAALRENAADPKNRVALESLAKTWEGAWSTISDVGRTVVATAFRPMFDLMTEGAVAVANFLQTDNFQVWAEAVRLGFEGAVGAVKGLLAALQPVGETIQTIFEQVTTGDFSGALGTITTSIQSVFTDALGWVQGFGEQMFGAGSTLIGEFAGGIIDGANGVLQGAIDAVAQMIASFLIGNSPPDQGPLAAIREGGANTIMAWGEGAAGAAEKAVTPVGTAIKENLKASAFEATDAIRAITDALQDVDRQARDLKYSADDLKDSYKDQLDPLEQQLKSLTDTKDMQAERHKLELSIEETQLRQAEIAAQGDPKERARLQGLLAALKSDQDRLKLQRHMHYLDKSEAGTEKDRLKDQLEATKMAREEADLRKQLKGAKGDDKAKIQDRLKELGVRKQIAEADKKEAAEKASRRREDVNFRSGELEIQQQIAGLGDKDALARIKKRQDEIKAEKDSLSLNEQGAKLQRDLLALPIREEIERIKKEQQDTLKPIEDQIKGLEHQKATLSDQRQEWQNIKGQIAEATSKIRDQETASKAADAAAKKAVKAGGGGGAPVAGAPAGGISFNLDASAKATADSIKARGAALASGMRDGFVEWITANPIMSAGTLAGALFGAGQGAALGASLGSFVPIFGTAIGGLLGAGIGAAIGAIGVGQLAGLLEARLTEIMGMSVGAAFKAFSDEWRSAFNEHGVLGVVQLLTVAVGDALAKGITVISHALEDWTSAFLDWADDVTRPTLDALSDVIDGVLGWIDHNAGPIGDALVDWGLAFVEWVTVAAPRLFSKLADLIGGILGWLGDNVTTIAGKLLDWGTAFIEWVGPVIPQLLTALGEMVASIVEWMGAHLGDLLDALGAWALAFVEWVGPKIPPLLIEVGKLLVSLTDWIVHTALPAIAAKLEQWGLAIVEWVGPRIGPLLEELGSLLLGVTGWMLTTALPAIVEQLAKWGYEFTAWVAPKIEVLLVELGKLLSAVGTWMQRANDPTNPDGIPQHLARWALSFLEWVEKNVLPTLGEKLDAIRVAIGQWVTDKTADIVNSAKALGAGLLEGIEQGLSDNWGALKDWINEHIGQQLPEWMQKLLGIHSPSTVFHDIGTHLIEGLINGMESKSGDLLEAAKKLLNFGSGGIEIPTGALVDLARKIADEFDLPSDVFVRQIKEESNFDPTAYNEGSGAAGLGQFVPGTAAAIARGLGMSLSELMGNPLNQLRGAAWYDNQIRDMFGGDIRKMLVGYNWGPGNARSWSGDLDELPGETRNYLRDILGLATGGIVTRPTLAMVAERGPEAVIPLSRAGGLGATYVTIDARGAQVYDGSKFEDMLVSALGRAGRRGRIVPVTRT